MLFELTLIDYIGWIGGLFVVIAYFMISSGKTDAKSPLFQTLNIAGSIFLIINTYAKEAYPSTVVNIVWVGIALYGFYRIWLDRKNKTAS